MSHQVTKQVVNKPTFEPQNKVARLTCLQVGNRLVLFNQNSSPDFVLRIVISLTEELLKSLLTRLYYYY